MTDQKDISAGRGGQVAGWVHFGVACLILAGFAVAFPWTVKAMKWVTRKRPVPWPDFVMVDPDTFRWTNLPEQVGGRFFLAGDGELTGQIDGKPDGESMLSDDVMETLGIGTSWDKTRVTERKSNWVSIRVYRDDTRQLGDPFRYWGLEVYYYTGALDTVPHIPERCLVAGGASVASSVDTTFQVPGARKGWDHPLQFRRAVFEVPNPDGLRPHRLTQYYIFSLNGLPESSWENVRLELTKPWVPYCYFAKIQFYPRQYTGQAELDVAEIDRAAEEFIGYFLPVILRALPTREEVDALSSGKPAN